MENCKGSSEVLAEIYRNAQLAQQSISDILPEIEDEGIREEVMRQHEEYEKVCSQAAHLAMQSGAELKEPGPVKKAMMWSAIKMNTMADNSAQHIAQLRVRGTVMGITSLKTTLSDSACTDGEVCDLLKKLIAMEEQFEEQLKKFL